MDPCVSWLPVPCRRSKARSNFDESIKYPCGYYDRNFLTNLDMENNSLGYFPTSIFAAISTRVTNASRRGKPRIELNLSIMRPGSSRSSVIRLLL